MANPNPNPAPARLVVSLVSPKNQTPCDQKLHTAAEQGPSAYANELYNQQLTQPTIPNQSIPELSACVRCGDERWRVASLPGWLLCRHCSYVCALLDVVLASVPTGEGECAFCSGSVKPSGQKALQLATIAGANQWRVARYPWREHAGACRQCIYFIFTHKPAFTQASVPDYFSHTLAPLASELKLQPLDANSRNSLQDLLMAAVEFGKRLRLDLDLGVKVLPKKQGRSCVEAAPTEVYLDMMRTNLIALFQLCLHDDSRSHLYRKICLCSCCAAKRACARRAAARLLSSSSRPSSASDQPDVPMN